MSAEASESADAKRIAELREELNHHIVLYHEKDDPEISDEEYERKRQDLLDRM